MNEIAQLLLQLGNPLHHNLLRFQTAVCLDVEVEFVRFGIKVERLVVPWGFFFFGVVGERPFGLDVGFVPVGRVAQFVVGVVFEGDGGTGRPFGVFFGDAFLGCAAHVEFLALADFAD